MKNLGDVFGCNVTLGNYGENLLRNGILIQGPPRLQKNPKTLAAAQASLNYLLKFKKALIKSRAPISVRQSHIENADFWIAKYREKVAALTPKAAGQAAVVTETNGVVNTSYQQAQAIKKSQAKATKKKESKAKAAKAKAEKKAIIKKSKARMAAARAREAEANARAAELRARELEAAGRPEEASQAKAAAEQSFAVAQQAGRDAAEAAFEAKAADNQANSLSDILSKLAASFQTQVSDLSVIQRAANEQRPVVVSESDEAPAGVDMSDVLAELKASRAANQDEPIYDEPLVAPSAQDEAEEYPAEEPAARSEFVTAETEASVDDGTEHALMEVNEEMEGIFGALAGKSKLSYKEKVRKKKLHIAKHPEIYTTRKLAEIAWNPRRPGSKKRRYSSAMQFAAQDALRKLKHRGISYQEMAVGNAPVGLLGDFAAPSLLDRLKKESGKALKSELKASAANVLKKGVDVVTSDPKVKAVAAERTKQAAAEGLAAKMLENQDKIKKAAIAGAVLLVAYKMFAKKGRVA